MNSDLAKKIYIAVKEGRIKSRKQFWRDYSESESTNALGINASECKPPYDVVCCFDKDFPAVPRSVKTAGKPFLFAFRGDIGLLKETVKNVAVIGVLTPDDTIIERETRIVGVLAGQGNNIVSGLAKGVDTAAHKETLHCAGKTIAFLPTALDSIYPTANRGLADEIVASGGLVITEYINEAADRFERIKRFIERDRLQVMFAKAVILIASYRKGEGDSGSRHAMQKAKEYGVKRFVMHNKDTDADKPIFALNRDLLLDGAEVLTSKSLCSL